MVYPRHGEDIIICPLKICLLVPKVGEVEEGRKGNGDHDHPGLDVDVRCLLLRAVQVPVKSQAKAYSPTNSVRWVVLGIAVVLVIYSNRYETPVRTYHSFLCTMHSL